MTLRPEDWPRLKEVFEGARALQAEARPAYVAAACGSDEGLRKEVETLLASHEYAKNFLETPAVLSRLESGSSLSFTALTPGSQLGSYQILNLLGTGGMGQVYRAFDPRLGRKVAIKVAAERFSERFDREVRAVAALNHPNICTLHDVGANYLVMELIDGETLREWFRRALPLDRSLGIARQVLEALSAAHRMGIVHRDLKPENVMVRVDGYVKVLDFGLATGILTSRLSRAESTGTVDSTRVEPDTEGIEDQRISLPGQILGTVAYMSPEQIQGPDVDQRSDLFAFGILLHEMLIGRHPWPRASAVETLRAILHDDPPLIEATPLVGPELAAVLQTLLRKRPAERYPSAEGVLEALATAATVRGSSTPTRASPKLLTSIAVLPFVVLSEVPDSKALSLGFADSLITIFGNLEDVVVEPTSAILNYAAGTEPALVCRDLGVRYTLQGTVQKTGAHWRVSIQLFDATTNKITFSEKHDFNLEDVFDVQDEIGRRVIESLQSRFPLAVSRSRDRYSSDPEAYSEFMEGLRKSSSDQPEVLESAILHLSTAVERDPEFALAHAWLSFVSMNMHFIFDPRPTRLEIAEHHCRQALMLDGALPEGHLARSWILWSPSRNFQHADAIAALERVLAARPNLERAHNRMSAICAHIGRLDEARLAHEHAQRSNPKTRNANLEYFYLYSGDFVRAEQAGEALFRDRPSTLYALSLWPQPPLMTGNLDRAEQRLAVAMKQLPDEPSIVSLQGMLHARRNQTDLALQCVRNALDCPRSFGHSHHTYYQIACVFAVLGETDKAMAWLERSVETGFACWPFFRVDPFLESLREESTFKRLVSDLEHKYRSLKIQRL
jgi:serine/threonine protein kinase/Tfp pilus assembly protein PilF